MLLEFEVVLPGMPESPGNFFKPPEAKIKEESKQEKFGMEEVGEYVIIRSKLSFLETKRDLTEADKADLEKLIDKYVELKIRLEKERERLSGPHFPTSFECEEAKNRGKEDEIWDEFYQDRAGFDRAWQKLSHEERRKMIKKKTELEEMIEEGYQFMSGADWYKARVHAREELIEAKKSEERKLKNRSYLSEWGNKN